MRGSRGGGGGSLQGIGELNFLSVYLKLLSYLLGAREAGTEIKKKFLE